MLIFLVLLTFTAITVALITSRYVFLFREKYEAQKSISTTDSLTHMSNLAGWQAKLKERLDTYKLNRRPFFLVYYDLDNFKFVNDTYGHLEGDNVLIQTATRWLNLASQQKFEVLFFRKGGDEFAALLETSSEEEANTFCLASLQAIKTTDVKTCLRFITASCGYLEINSNIPPKLAEDRADYALRKAKQSGKNQVAKLDATLEKELEKITSLNNKVIHMLNTENQDKQILFTFQKIINLKENKTIGYEVLSTYSDKDGDVSILDILEAAERVGKSVDFDFLVLDKVLVKAKELANFGEITVNFSSRTVGSSEFIGRFKEAIKKHPDFPVTRLMLDLKEISYVRNRSEIKKALLFIRSLGCKVSIDDFGIGCSSYAYLTDLETVIDRVKIDKEFIQKISTRPSVVSGILAMCKELKLEIVAEGIETQEQLKWLRDRDVLYGQGFAIEAPRMLEDVQEELKGNQAITKRL